ncbi:MAG: polysaccharide pyruvyl transferase family protein [Gammaproteobacteria bacterium]|nr:polysaccharide pyruvyl transferase family protein [Gammaproteobacteria bacterium]
MKLFYYKDAKGNFGDDLNPWLFDNICPELLDNNADDLLIGVGTLLNHRVPKNATISVFGSGFGYGELPEVNTKWHFHCVRGPRTAKALGLDASVAITDPAALASIYYSAAFSKQYPVSFIPHHVSANFGDWKSICEQAGINYIDPSWHYLKVFEQLKKSSLVITEAMHGAILADAFRVPWIPVKAYPHILESKWSDWLDTVQLSAGFNQLPSIFSNDKSLSKGEQAKIVLKRSLRSCGLWRADWTPPPPANSSRRLIDTCAEQLQKLASTGQSYLSADAVLQNNLERLLAAAEQLKQSRR